MEFNGEFMARMLPRIEYKGLMKTLHQLDMVGLRPAHAAHGNDWQ